MATELAGPAHPKTTSQEAIIEVRVFHSCKAVISSNLWTTADEASLVQWTTLYSLVFQPLCEVGEGVARLDYIGYCACEEAWPKSHPPCVQLWEGAAQYLTESWSQS